MWGSMDTARRGKEKGSGSRWENHLSINIIEQMIY